MITTKLYLDKRSPNSKGECPLKVTMTLRSKSAHLPIGVRLLPSQWDAAKSKVKDHPKKAALTNHIMKLKLDIDDAILKLKIEGKLAGLSITEIKNEVLNKLNPKEDDKDLFYPYFIKFGESHRAARTRSIYASTAIKLKEFKRNIKSITFEDINKQWLNEFVVFLTNSEKSANSRNIHLRNIRAAFNSAIDDNITHHYPFRKYAIKAEATKKRALVKDQLIALFNVKTETEAEEWAIDFAKLLFLLIGINTVDLCNLTEIVNGRIEYNRSKTGRHYSILVPHEAMEIINKQKGETHLIDAIERYTNVAQVTKNLCRTLHKISERIDGMPKVSAYWMRHSWATIASELDIPKETIAAGLGHGGTTVTDIYIDYNIKKVDEANKKVIEYIFG